MTPEPAGTGSLTARAHPAAQVIFDGRVLGSTPLTRVVPAGKRRVKLVELGTGEVRFDGLVDVPKDGKVVVNPNQR